MRRRALLASMAAATATTAGCSVLDSTNRTRDTFAVDETTTDPPTSFADAPPTAIEPGFAVPGDDDRVVAVTTPTDIPQDVALTLGIASKPTPDAPASVYVRLLVPGAADGPVALPVGATPPFSGYRSTADRAGRRLVLVPRRRGVDRESVVKRDRGCWRPRTDPIPAARSDTVVLDPGDSLGREYALVTSWSSDVCLPTGVFEFRAEADWSFAVSSFQVERPRRSAFASTDVPTLPGYRATRWFHDGTGDLFVSPSSESVGLPTASLRLRFRNQLWRTIGVRARSWALYKFADDAWYPIAPLSSVDDRRDVLPGGTVDANLSLATNPDAASAERATVGGLGKGTYAVAYPGVFDIPGRAATLEARGPPAALLSVVGPTPAFDATDAIDHVRDDDGVRHLYTTPDESSVATLRLAPSTASDLPRLLREQALQREALRNAVVALADADDAGDDVDAVVYHTDATAVERTTAWIDPEAAGYAFRFEGNAYELAYG